MVPENLGGCFIVYFIRVILFHKFVKANEVVYIILQSGPKIDPE